MEEINNKKRIKEDSLLIIDPSDIHKKYAKQMEHLAWVRDGSEKKENKIVKVYWLLQIIGAELEEVDITPLYGELFSQEAPGHESENDTIITAIDMVRNRLDNKGIWVGDRGLDRINLYDDLLNRNQKFIIRLRGDRFLIHKGKKIISEDLALKYPKKTGKLYKVNICNGKRIMSPFSNSKMS